jgi:hypothetical protein
MWHVRLTLESLREEGAEPSLLGQNRIQPDLSEVQGLSRFFSYGDATYFEIRDHQ